jgi:hypothetical protein
MLTVIAVIQIQNLRQALASFIILFAAEQNYILKCSALPLFFRPNLLTFRRSIWTHFLSCPVLSRHSSIVLKSKGSGTFAEEVPKHDRE